MENTNTIEVQRPAWYRPSVRRLVIALDTRLGEGSVIDEDGFDFVGQDLLTEV